MTRSVTNLFLPDGRQVVMPVASRTWADAAAAAAGDPLRSTYLSLDAGGAVAWHRQLALFQGVPGAVQSVPASAWTVLTGLAEMIDNYGCHNDTGNTGRFYAPQTNTNTSTSAGDWFLCTGYVPFNSSDTTSVFVAGLRVNGTTVYEGQKQPSAAGHVVDCMVMDLVQLSGYNDNYVELAAWQNTAAAVSTTVTGKAPSLTVRWAVPDQTWGGVATPAVPAIPHTWTAADAVSGSATGGAFVPMNRELRDIVRFLNNPPAARLTSLSTTQTIPTGATWTSLTFTATGESLDNYGGWSSGSPTRYVCQRPGLYLLYGLAAVTEPASPAGYRAARLLINGTTAYAGGSVLPASGTTAGTAVPASAQVRLAVGDYVELQMQQTQGAALTVKSGVGDASRLIALWKSL